MKLSFNILRSNVLREKNKFEANDLRESIFASIKNLPKSNCNDTIELAEHYFNNDDKPKIQVIKEAALNSNADYIVFIDEYFTISPFYFQYVLDGIHKRPDSLSCSIKYSEEDIMYSLNHSRQGYNLSYPSYFNVIKRELYSKIEIPDIKELTQQCISDLFKESNVLKEEYFIFDTLILN